MEQNVEIKKPVPNPRDMAAGEIVVNVQKTDENGVTIKLWPDVSAVRNHMNDLVSLVPCDTYSVRHYTCGRFMRMLKANRGILMDTTEPQQFRLRDALDEVAVNDGLYDYCIMDCPPDLDMGSINALCAADWVIIPVDCDEWACDGMREIVDQIERVQMYYNPHLKIMGALMTKYRRTRYAAEVVHQLNDAGVEMLGTVIRYTIKVSEAKSAHKPLRAYRPDCSAATDYGCLADEVEEIVSRMDTKEG